MNRVNLQCSCGAIVDLPGHPSGTVVRCPACKTKYRITSEISSGSIDPFSWNHLDSPIDLSSYGPSPNYVREEIPTTTIIRILTLALGVAVLLVGSVVSYDLINDHVLTDPKSGESLKEGSAKKLNNQMFEARAAELKLRSEKMSEPDETMELPENADTQSSADSSASPKNAETATPAAGTAATEDSTAAEAPK